MRRHFPLIFAAVLSWSALAHGQASRPADPALDTLLADLDRRAAAVVDLTASFEQDKISPLLKKPLRSSGIVRAKGSAMLWDTRSPSKTVMRVDGQSLQLLYVDQEILEVYPLDTKLAKMAASPLPRLQSLREQFAISLKERTEKQLVLDLTPTDEKLQQHVSGVVVTIDLGQAVVTRFELTDPDGERTVIQFSDYRINTNLTDAQLELHAPDGTKVVRPLDGAP